MIWDPVLWAVAFSSLGVAVGSTYTFFIMRRPRSRYQESEGLPLEVRDEVLKPHPDMHDAIQREMDLTYPQDGTSDDNDIRLGFMRGWVAALNWIKVGMGLVTEEGTRKYYERLGVEE